MENKINIAAILKDKPKGTKLYSYICAGECILNEVSENAIYVDMYNKERFWYFSVYGTIYAFQNGGVLLYPSKEMQDWRKFAWKKGDVLQHTEYPLTVIFESFEDDTYTSFKCKYCFNFESASKWLVSNSQCSTKHFYKVSEEEAKEFIKKVELNYNGKLKMETLEIEPSQPEFKDGDVLFVKCEKQDFIEIFNHSKKNGDLYDHASLDTTTQVLDISGKYRIGKDEITEIRIATEEEKQQLFDALAKEGKAWDAEKKLIVDLKPKCEFKPFDKVLCRNSKDDTWEADFFARLTRKEIDYTQSGKYLCVGDLWMYCIPYNEETAHLLGTTDEWKGGEG